MVEEKFSTENRWKSWKLFHKEIWKKFAGKWKKCLTEGDSVRYTVELQACPHFGTRIDPITGDEFLRRIQPWRELFSPRSVIARKFMAFWPAWAPRTAARSSMLAVLRAARAWPSDPVLPGIRRRIEHAHKRLLILNWRSFSYFGRSARGMTKNLAKDLAQKTPGQPFHVGVFLLYWILNFAFGEVLRFFNRKGGDGAVRFKWPRS